MKRYAAYLSVATLLVQLTGCASAREPTLLAQEVAKYSVFLAEEISNYRKREAAVVKQRELILEELTQSVLEAEKRYQLARVIHTSAYGADYKSVEQSLITWLNEVNSSRRQQISSGETSANEKNDAQDITSLLALSKNMAELGRDDDSKRRIKFFGNYAKAVVVDIKNQKDLLEERFGDVVDFDDLNIFTILKQQDDENE